MTGFKNIKKKIAENCISLLSKMCIKIKEKKTVKNS